MGPDGCHPCRRNRIDDHRLVPRRRWTPSVRGSVVLGRELFARQWTANDPRCHGGDGLGPVYNATSCLACHYLGGAGGSGPASRNVILLNANPSNFQWGDLDRMLHPGFRDSKSLVFHHHGAEPTRYEGWRSRSSIRSANSPRNTPRGFGTGPSRHLAGATRRRSSARARSMPSRTKSSSRRPPGATTGIPRSMAGFTG